MITLSKKNYSLKWINEQQQQQPQPGNIKLILTDIGNNASYRSEKQVWNREHAVWENDMNGRIKDKTFIADKRKYDPLPCIFPEITLRLINELATNTSIYFTEHFVWLIFRNVRQITTSIKTKHRVSGLCLLQLKTTDRFEIIFSKKFNGYWFKQ